MILEKFSIFDELVKLRKLVGLKNLDLSNLRRWVSTLHF